jgi:hypothetical protein
VKVHYNDYNVNFIGSFFATTYISQIDSAVKLQAAQSVIESN